MLLSTTGRLLVALKHHQHEKPPPAIIFGCLPVRFHFEQLPEVALNETEPDVTCVWQG